MDLAEAESAAISAGRQTTRTGLRVANVGQPRDSVTDWEERVQAQFSALQKFAQSRGCSLKEKHLPPRACGKSGREHEVFHAPSARRIWKSTFPGESGFGQFGYYTPAGYLRRLRLSNIVFGDDVTFEGVWSRSGGLSLVTSQSYIQAHPVRFIPTQEEIETYLGGLGFTHNDSLMLWERADGVQLADTHDRNFIRAPDECIIAIDVQPRLLPGHDFQAVRPA
ncbi:MAG: hypothetical protein NTV80_12145 [Verrucomicrobia bacterium]|nr:hypothetical protein [Verrucomicrobiota bacterium]